MTLSPSSSDLLAAVPGVLDGVVVRVLLANGSEAESFGDAGGGERSQRSFDLPVGQIVASYPSADPAVATLVASLLSIVSERERLESDMESMSTSSLRLLEQVAMLTETLPRLSAGLEDTDIAALGARACQVAASVQQVIYLGYNPAKDLCEALVRQVGEETSAAARAGDQELDPLLPAGEGVLADVLAVTEGVVLRTVPEGGRLGEPGSPEYLARHQILGVPVTYGAGDKRVVLGALLLIDKRGTAYSSERQLGSEEGQVAESFAAMLGAVLGARKTAALGKELSMAQAIQRQILPERAVELGGFDIAADYQACGAVGGDYFDYVTMADGRTLVVVADVSGHNLASGMMMVSARATLRTLATVRSDPAQVFEDLAFTMHGDLTRTERFLTAAAVALRADASTVEYVSAGHNDLFVYRAASDRVERVESESTILGFLQKPGYTSRTIDLAEGDCLLLFTDGITEAMDAQGEMFGEERLAALLAQVTPGRTARGIVDALIHELEVFRGGPVGNDDVTAVVVRCVAQGGRR